MWLSIGIAVRLCQEGSSAALSDDMRRDIDAWVDAGLGNGRDCAVASKAMERLALRASMAVGWRGVAGV
jgi:hypothetical protein